jgi:hypothetical protein
MEVFVLIGEMVPVWGWEPDEDGGEEPGEEGEWKKR